MNTVSIKANFAERDDYRLLAMDSAWVTALKESCLDIPSQRSCKRAREEADGPNTVARVSVVLAMKGTDQLCANDSSETLAIRRVEYSNTLLIAERHRKGSQAVSAAAVAPAASATALRESTESVVIASLARLFEAHKAAPRHTVMEVLKDSTITIAELEGSAENALVDATTGSSQRLYTFRELAVMNHASPKELARILTSAGALVHRGHVRILDTADLHHVLHAVLTFVSAAEASELSWAAIERHFCPTAFPRVAMGAVREVYGGHTATTPDSTEVESVGLDTLLDLRKVCIGLAGTVFDDRAPPGELGAERPKWTELPHGVRAASLPFQFFYDQWMASIPDAVFGKGILPERGAAVEAHLAILSGYLVCHKLRRDSYDGALAWWIAQETLPNDIQKRLDVLFTIHDGKYLAEVLRPYIEPLLGPEQTFTHTMLRFAREYRVPGEPVAYSRLAV